MEGVPKLVACALSLVLTGFAGSAQARDRLDFVKTPAAVERACSVTAEFVGYAVPCPREVPRGLVAESGGGGCAGGVIFAPFRNARTCEGARGWRGWVAGAGVAPDDVHVALIASPHVEPDVAKLVNGPAWYPGARVQLLGSSRVGGRLIRWAFVPAATNDGSQFADAVAAAWTAGGHSYAIGFRVPAGGRAAARVLGQRLLASVTMVTRPS
jgi:hypothetical protein